MTPRTISELEAEIARHKRFMALPNIFTLVEVNSTRTHKVPTYTIGNVYESYQRLVLPIHYQDNTSGRILEYLKPYARRKIFDDLLGDGCEPIFTCDWSDTDGEGHMISTGRLREPATVYYPHNRPIDFYSAFDESCHDRDPRVVIEGVKNWIKGNVGSEIISLESWITVIKEGIEKREREIAQQKKREQESERLKEQFNGKGIKI